MPVTSAYAPAGQLVHSVVRPTSLATFPYGHGRQAESPVLALYVPARQGVQVVRPVVPEYEPWAQAVQDELSVAPTVIE